METNELKHYGVIGMKWGVHRAKKELSKGNTSAGMDRLARERAKASKKLLKLKKKGVRYEGKSAKYKRKASRIKLTEIGVGLEKHNMRKAARADTKAYKNHKRQVSMEKGISQIDKMLIDVGRSYVEKKVQ